MPEYRVRWEIDVQADSHQEAARKALEVQRNEDSIATVFEVWPHSTPTVAGYPITFETVDLSPQFEGQFGE